LSSNTNLRTRIQAILLNYRYNLKSIFLNAVLTISQKMQFFSDRKFCQNLECIVPLRACRKRENSSWKKSLRLRMYKDGIPHLTVLCEQTIRTPETVRT